MDLVGVHAAKQLLLWAHGRFGAVHHTHSGLKQMLADMEFCKRNCIKMRINPRTGYREADLSRYFLSPQDFACQPDGTPYPHDHEKAMEEDGGGRIKRRAFERVFGTPQNGRFGLLKRWACDDRGRPEEE